MKIISYLLIILSFFGCVSKNIQDTELKTDAKLSQLKIESSFDYSKTTSAGYQYVFSMTKDGAGFENRVATFESIDDWKADTRNQLSYSKDTTGQDYILQTLSEQILKQVNFSKENLIIVHLNTSGPPFGELKNELKAHTYEFYLKESDDQIRGMALKTYFNFYKTPKPYKAMLRK